MKRFNDYYLINGFVDEPEYLSEGIFGDVWKTVKRGFSKLVSFIKNSLSKLKPGGVTTISLSSLSGLKEAYDDVTWDLTSRIGYYHEHCVGFEMAKILRDRGLDVVNQKGELFRRKLAYRKEIEDNVDLFKANQQKNISKELTRAEDGAELVAAKIVSEIENVEDIFLMEFEITHTGTAMMGQAKEDVSLMVRKKDSQEIADEIKASLKLYKQPRINLSNKTFASFINGVLFPKVDLKGKKFLAGFMAGHPEWEDLILQMSKHSDQWKETKRTVDRQEANAEINGNRGFQAIRNGILQTIFDKAYANDKAGINKRIIETLGLDGSDEVYMVIGTEKSNMKVISSRSSEEFKTLYESLKSNFTISFTIPKDPNIVACYMKLTDDKGNLLISTNYSFKEGDIFVQFLDMKSLLPPEYEPK
jgi:hypothetical protein